MRAKLCEREEDDFSEAVKFKFEGSSPSSPFCVFVVVSVGFIRCWLVLFGFTVFLQFFMWVS